MPTVIVDAPTTKTAIPDLKPGTNYTIKLKAHSKNRADSAEVKTTADTKSLPKLTTPVPVAKGTPTTAAFAAEWPAVPDADAMKGDAGYTVTVAPDDGRVVSKVDVTTPGKPSVSVTGAKADTSYTVKVTALGDLKQHSDSDEGSVAVKTAKLTKLTGPDAAQIVKDAEPEATKLSVKWPKVEHAKADAAGYTVICGTKTEPTTPVGTYKWTGTTEHPKGEFTGLTAKTEYTVTVTPKSGAGGYSDGDPVKAKTPIKTADS